ncbi:MAG: HAD-superfamily hydrolase, subfamily IA, variant 3 [Candidatus Gottesmanbacteria bacterium GW2011_GWC2_39_8]|uniref:HAD-superfamily hydrolase, subfamily IA, variant 3 n=1 Tax=Candidatus Gottesmanbacteria bacterium GW2011_GWC2_39_8 TaxID=1618450 RepID=A0A0G0PXF8_9BACT|nr:MAG: HAD-superfamily hydrolase, subfamily IA, variant 3 [Candidatus Gottesmanbacteria bacterium GW2011_GWC2_39_8]
MNKAFIFDMDGIIINSEPVWEKYEQVFLPELMGSEIYFKIKDKILGRTIDYIYETAGYYGLRLNKEKYIKTYDKYAEKVYSEAGITPGTDELIEVLNKFDFKLGLVTASRKYWVELVMKRLRSANKFQYILSLNDNPDIRPKPFSDGYRKAMLSLGSIPKSTIILEDSEQGIKAAKASKALTICFRENLESGKTDADVSVNTIENLITFFKIFKL